MKCAKCNRQFDEEMYSGICPKCGHFNNRQAEYDVSKYFSAKFEEGGKTSTSAQAQKQHAELHKMYDRQNMHKEGKPNPYQPAAMQGNTYQAGQKGAYQQGNTHQARQSSANQKGNYPQKEKYGRAAKLNGEVKEKNIVTPICIVIAVLAVIVTVLAVQVKKQNLLKIYNTLDYEQQYAEAGELFEIYDRLLMVEKAEVIDTSGLGSMPVGEKLVAVTLEILSTDDWKRNRTSGLVYVSDGHSCKQYVDSYVVHGLIGTQDVLTGYDYLSYASAKGMTGRFYFFVNEDANEITISFDEDEEKDNVFVLQKRVSIPLLLEEEGS